MANTWEKAIPILAVNLNLGLSYLITTVQINRSGSFNILLQQNLKFEEISLKFPTKLLLQNKFHSIEVNDAGLTLGLLWLWHFLPISPEISPLVPQSQLWKGEEDDNH